MYHQKQEFQPHTLSSLHPIGQQQESLELQNYHFRKSMSEIENSFISTKNQFQTLNQNLNFSDHTLKYHKNQLHNSHLQNQTANDNVFDQCFDTISSANIKDIETQEFKNSSKLQEQLSLNKSLIPENQNFSFSDQHSLYLDQQQISSATARGLRKKKMPDNLVLTHKDHMMLGSKVISGLEKNIVSLPFREPVDVEKLNIADYLDIIKQPMDLRSIKRKIFNEEYQKVDQIYADIELIISNSMRYNQLNSDFIRLTKNFQKSYFKIRRDCERNMRKFKFQKEKKNQSNLPDKIIKKSLKSSQMAENNFPTDQVQILSNFQFSELIRLAKKIKKLQAQEQIQLFKKINIFDKMVIDIKDLSTKQVRCLMRETEKIEKAKQELIRNQQKKENSHLTTYDNEYKSPL